MTYNRKIEEKRWRQRSQWVRLGLGRYRISPSDFFNQGCGLLVEHVGFSQPLGEDMDKIRGWKIPARTHQKGLPQATAPARAEVGTVPMTEGNLSFP